MSRSSMPSGFASLMGAQFFSSLADNALFMAAIALLRQDGHPVWQQAALVPMFALFYVLLAPFVGALADAFPKGSVMLWSNGIKALGCLSMVLGLHPLIAYAIVGLGAALYSPAKYGILTEMARPSQLVRANGWIEGLTIASIISGALLGGLLLRDRVARALLAFDFPFIDTPVDTAPEAAISFMIVFYGLAALLNLFIPATGVRPRPLEAPSRLVVDFWRCHLTLWRDKLGQISLATTTLFWGVSGNLRHLVLAWAAAALGFGLSESSSLLGAVALGTALGAILASRSKLSEALSLLPLGMIMGFAMLSLIFVGSLRVALPFLLFLGALGGFLVVPMNALLQHRGHSLMGAGRSIAVQNFNEQACILLLGGLYSALAASGLSTFSVIAIFSLLVAFFMGLIELWHRRSMIAHPRALEELRAHERDSSH